MTNTTIEIRKRPVQARSKARVDAILMAAKNIISEVGSDGLKMSVLAQQAKVPIGTVYQFFPNKSAVIHTLVQSTMDDLSAGLAHQFEGTQDLRDATTRLERAVAEYCQLMREEPVIRDILTSTQGDNKLRALDRQDSERNGEMLFAALSPFVAVKMYDAFRITCFLNVHLVGALARLCSAVDEDTASALQAQFIQSTKRDLMTFAPTQQETSK